MKVRLLDLFRRKVPILEWLPKYNSSTGVADVLAGITVGLTLIPQAIAYASLAGLNPKYGLYSSIFGGVMYIFLGTTKQLSVGPTSIMALLCLTYTHDTNLDMVALLTCLTGLVQLICGLLNLGFVVEFVSLPVVSGFTSATAIIMASSQLKYFLGIKFKPKNFIDMYVQLYRNIGYTNFTDLTLGVACIVLLLGFKRLQDLKLCEKREKFKFVKSFIWFISTGRNAFILMGCAVITYVLKNTHETVPFALVGKIESGFPRLAVPPIHTIVNGTELSLIDMLSHLNTGIFLVPLVGLVANVAIAKAFSEGRIVDASQEMIALGMGNLAGSFINAMPVASSFSRSAVNNASGVRTPLGGLYTSVIVLLSLSLLTPYLQYIPQASLAAVLVCAVLTLVEIEIAAVLWKTNKRNFFTLILTFSACLFIGIEAGLLCGICLDIVNLLHFNARPVVHFDKKVTDMGFEFWIFEPSGGLLFPTVDYLREVVLSKLVEENNKNKVFHKSRAAGDVYIIINCSHIDKTDYTAARGMVSLAEDLLHKKCQLVVINAIKPVHSAFSSADQNARIHVYSTYQDFVSAIHKDFYDVRNSVDTLSELHHHDTSKISSETIF
uniref:Sodium-independent sulfate anion transporter n=2 Tax=Cacopsylla melanoneura TaxID=428564 RepID=A0A8D8M7I3_9HEMI